MKASPKGKEKDVVEEHLKPGKISSPLDYVGVEMAALRDRYFV